MSFNSSKANMKSSTTHRLSRGGKPQYQSGQKMHHNNYSRYNDDPGVLSPPWSTLWSQFVIGQIGEFTMNNGDTITGLVSAISPFCDFGLQLSQSTSDSKSHKTNNSLKYRDISKIIIRDVDPAECLEAIAFTDEEISKQGSRTCSTDHELVPYFDNSESADHEYDFSSSTEVFTPQEMFRKNEQEFQVVSSFKEDLEGYTTKIDTSAPDYEEKLKHYTKMAAEIEGTTAADDDEALDMENEEEKYSSVYRGPPLQQRGVINRGPRGNGPNRSMTDFQQTGPRRMTKAPVPIKSYNGVLAEPNKLNGSQPRPYMQRPLKGDLPEDVKVEQKPALPNQERVSASLSPALSSPKWPEKRSDSSMSASMSISQDVPAADHKSKFEFDLDAPEFNPVAPAIEPVVKSLETMPPAPVPQPSLVAYSQPNHPAQSPSQNGSIQYAAHSAQQFQTMPALPNYHMAAATPQGMVLMPPNQKLIQFTRPHQPNLMASISNQMGVAAAQQMQLPPAYPGMMQPQQTVRPPQISQMKMPAPAPTPINRQNSMEQARGTQPVLLMPPNLVNPFMTQHHAPQAQVSAVPVSYPSIYNATSIPAGVASNSVHQFAQQTAGPVFTQPVSQGHPVQAPSASQQHQTQMAYQHYAQQQFPSQGHLFQLAMAPQNVAPAAHMYPSQFSIYQGAAQSMGSPYMMNASGVAANSSNT